MTYQEGKTNAREKAIQWQQETAGKDLSYDELLEAEIYFENLGQKYGLMNEFKENGIL